MILVTACCHQKGRRGYGAGMTLPEIATRDEWLKARRKLWKQEKDLTHRRDRISADRRRLPMVKIEKQYVFEDSTGTATLLDMFEGRSQLIVRALHVRSRVGRGLLQLLGGRR